MRFVCLALPSRRCTCFGVSTYRLSGWWVSFLWRHFCQSTSHTTCNSVTMTTYIWECWLNTHLLPICIFPRVWILYRVGNDRYIITKIPCRRGLGICPPSCSSYLTPTLPDINHGGLTQTRNEDISPPLCKRQQLRHSPPRPAPWPGIHSSIGQTPGFRGLPLRGPEPTTLPSPPLGPRQWVRLQPLCG